MRPKLPSLDGLRGVLAMVVCVGHLGLNTVLARFGITVSVGVAVDVFFALSGFVLAHTSFFGRKPLTEFAWGRVARLWPLHVVTGLAALPSSLADGAITPLVALQQFTLTQCLGFSPHRGSLNMPAWSISVEFWLSIAFAALLVRRVTWPLAAVAVVASAWVTIGSGDHQPFAFTSYGVLRGVAGFAVGVLAYQLHERAIQWPRWAAYASVCALVPFFAIAQLREYPLAFYALTFAALVTLASTRTVLDAGPLAWLGNVSYSIYLWHMPIAYLAGDAGRGMAAKVAMVAGVLAVAWMSQRFIEGTAQGALRRLARVGEREVAA